LQSITKAKENPFDTYTKEVICNIIKQQPEKRLRDCDIYFVFDQVVSLPDESLQSKRLAFQALAEAIGFAFMIPGTGLQACLDFGPWFSYRAVIVWKDSCELYDTNDLISKHNTNLEKWISECVSVKQAQDWKDRVQFWIENPNAATWKDWASLRMEIGEVLQRDQFRYSDQQLGYHYSGDRRFVE
jgi:hypothetical protein